MKKHLISLFLLFALLPLSAHAAGDPVTRGGFAVLLWESRGGVPFDKTAHPFADLPDDGQAQAVAWAYCEGLVQGVGGGLFAPDRPLTREECAVLLRRLDASLGRDVFFPGGGALCNDYQDISPWADDSLYWACVTGRMAWRENRLAPQGPVSRTEAWDLLFSPHAAMSGSGPGWARKP